MKSLSYKLIPLLAFSMCVATVPISAEKVVPGSDGGVKTLKSIIFTAGTMIDAVKYLHGILENEGFEPMNIIMNEEIEQVDVPKLRLRNVTGPDALQLLAAAAIKPCLIKPIISGQAFGGRGSRPNQWVIGYSVHLAQISRPSSSSRSTSNASRTVEATPADGMLAAEAVRLLDENRDKPFSPESPTRVYPLGGIISTYDKAIGGEMMDTLKAVLEADGIDPKDAKISLHKKINVMLVHGPEKVHKLVNSLLESLATNTAKRETKSNEGRVPILEFEIKKLLMELDDERDRRKIAENEKRLIQQELERLKNKQAEPEK
jgi:hypothetical protein